MNLRRPRDGPTALHTKGDSGHNAGYGKVICAALPPLNTTQIATLGTVLCRHSPRRDPTQPPDTPQQRRAA